MQFPQTYKKNSKTPLGLNDLIGVRLPNTGAEQAYNSMPQYNLQAPIDDYASTHGLNDLAPIDRNTATNPTQSGTGLLNSNTNTGNGNILNNFILSSVLLLNAEFILSLYRSNIFSVVMS